MLGGVDHRFARRAYQRLDLLGGVAVADHHQLDGNAPLVLDLGGSRCQCGLERRFMQFVAVQPVAQLSLLAAGQLLHRLGVVRLPLDHGESLQHRVMQVGSHVRTGICSDLLSARLVEC